MAINENIIWCYTSEPRLKMRHFSDEFLEEYLVKAGAAITASVGCYFIEDLGIQLFSDVNGDYNDIFYTIMATNWFIGVVVLIFIGYFLNNVFKQNKSLFTY